MPCSVRKWFPLLGSRGGSLTWYPGDPLLGALWLVFFVVSFLEKETTATRATRNAMPKFDASVVMVTTKKTSQIPGYRVRGP